MKHSLCSVTSFKVGKNRPMCFDNLPNVRGFKLYNVLSSQSIWGSGPGFLYNTIKIRYLTKLRQVNTHKSRENKSSMSKSFLESRTERAHGDIWNDRVSREEEWSKGQASKPEVRPHFYLYVQFIHSYINFFIWFQNNINSKSNSTFT